MVRSDWFCYRLGGFILPIPCAPVLFHTPPVRGSRSLPNPPPGTERLTPTSLPGAHSASGQLACYFHVGRVCRRSKSGGFGVPRIARAGVTHHFFRVI